MVSGGGEMSGLGLLRLSLVLIVTANIIADISAIPDHEETVGGHVSLGELADDVLLDIGSGAKVSLSAEDFQDPADEPAGDQDSDGDTEAAIQQEASADPGKKGQTEDHAKLEYAVFKAMTGGTLEFDKASHYIRHMGDSAEVTTASSENDKRDIVWKVRSPLCAPGSGNCPPALEGEPKCMSFESANWKGYYLRHKDNRLRLEKPTGTTLAQSTFCMRPGLSDKRAISFESLDKPKSFVRHNSYHLYVCDNTNEGGCGRTSLDAFRKDTTFTKDQPDFFGTCEGPTNPQKCSCARGRTGPKCMVQCPGLLDGGKVACSGQGACFFDTKSQKASCRCQDGVIGNDCAEQCPKGLSEQVCSKNGKCSLDRLGQAKCECTGPWRGKTCDARCPGATEDSVCSGHGACMYDEVKKVTFCKCEKGFLGDKCKTTCPKDDKGRICSGEGECVPGGVSGGKCLCREGFMGSDCALQCRRDPLGRVCGGGDRGVCEKESDKGTTVCKCKKGFMGKTCDVECPRTKDGKVCSGNGTCFMDANSKQTKCVCKKGFTGDHCQVKCETNGNGDVCNGHGKCSTSDGSAAKCACEGGFVGAGCEHNCPGGAKTGGKVACSGHGTCDLKGGKAGCSCAAGFLGEGCDTACPKNNGITCGGEGECKLKDGQATCKCKEGFMGSSCQYECPGRTSTHVCSGKGKCLLEGGEGGKGFATKCLCDKGHGGRICEQSCPFKQHAGKSVPCFGQGDCVATPESTMKCMCKKGWLGDDCSVPCPTSKNGEVCSRRGMCTPTEDKKAAQCDCKDGYVGPSCSHICPKSNGAICAGHGKCSFDARDGGAVCKCAKDFAGATCSESCPKDENGTICNGNGSCKLKDNLAVCECNAGFSGKDCEHRVCSTANSLFDTKTSRCLCEPGYTCCSRQSMEAGAAPAKTVEDLDDLAEFKV